MEKKEIRERVEKILLKHEENTSEGSIYWDFEWVGGKRIPTGGGGYRQEGGEAVYADKAFYEEMTDFISQELDKAREEERERTVNIIEGMKYKGDTEKFKHIKITHDCKTVEEYIWFIGGMTLNRVLSKLKDNK